MTHHRETYPSRSRKSIKLGIRAAFSYAVPGTYPRLSFLFRSASQYPRGDTKFNSFSRARNRFKLDRFDQSNWCALAMLPYYKCFLFFFFFLSFFSFPVAFRNPHRFVFTPLIFIPKNAIINNVRTPAVVVNNKLESFFQLYDSSMMSRTVGFLFFVFLFHPLR